MCLFTCGAISRTDKTQLLRLHCRVGVSETLNPCSKALVMQDCTLISKPCVLHVLSLYCTGLGSRTKFSTFFRTTEPVIYNTGSATSVLSCGIRFPTSTEHVL